MIEPRERAPYHGPTGLTLCIAPPEYPLNLEDPAVSSHHGNHSQYGKTYLKTLEPFGPAVYASRVQHVENIHHNVDIFVDPQTAQRQLSYHPTFARSKVPQSEVGQARITLFGALIAVPGKVLDFKRGCIRPITDAERKRLFESGELGVQSREIVSGALTQFAISKGLPHMKREEMNAYRDARWASKRKAIVTDFMHRILPIAYDPIRERFIESMVDGSLPPSTPPTVHEAAGQFIYGNSKLFTIFHTEMLKLQECRSVA